MNYGLAAGALVTLSLFLLALDVPGSPAGTARDRGACFVLPYLLGVACWVLLGIRMDQTPLVIISALQLFSLAIYWVRTNP